MAYLGNSPARSFISFERQVFTIVNSQTVYTLDHSVTNENDIRLVVNNVVQEPGSGKAYTATGTTLTLSAALVNGTDEMYCVFLGRATATNAPGAGSVGTSQLAADAVTNAKVASSIITGQTAETSIATDDLILLSDTSASGALKKMTRANFVSGIGGANTPYFNVYRSSNQTGISDDTNTVAALDQEYYDSAGAYDTSTYRFTPQTAGKYFLWFCFRGVSGDQALVAAYSNIRKNGSNIVGASSASSFEGTSTRYVQIEATTSVIATANGSSDYFDFSFTLDVASGSNFYLHKDGTNAGGYKIIE